MIRPVRNRHKSMGQGCATRAFQPKVRAARTAGHDAGDMVQFRPITAEGENPFAMLTDLWIKHRDWVFEPIYYLSLGRWMTRSFVLSR